MNDPKPPASGPTSPVGPGARRAIQRRYMVGQESPKKRHGYTPGPAVGDVLITGPDATGPQATQTGDEIMATKLPTIIPTEPPPPPPPEARHKSMKLVLLAGAGLSLMLSIVLAWAVGWIP